MEQTDLRNAVRTIHADPWWWRKVLAGGALMLTFVFWPIVEGFGLESMENSQRGYPTPLPRWNEWGNKFVVGLFALVLDFFFFVFPMLIAGIILFCTTLAIGLNSSMASTVVASVITVIALGYLLGIWMLGASPIAKQRYVKDGNLEQSISGGFLRDLARKPTRSTYIGARMRSLPFYLVACTLLIVSGVVASRSTAFGLIIAWLGMSGIVYARLITIQLYDAATRRHDRQRFEERQRAMGYGG